MRLAIKSRSQGKPPFCHLCRKIIKFALKIEVPEDIKKSKSKENIEYSPTDKGKVLLTPGFAEKKQKECFVKIISYVDMDEA